MATVRKRKWTHKGVEREAWVVSYTDQSGKRRLKTFDKKREADAYRIHIEGEIQSGVHTPASDSVTLAAAASAYLKERDELHRIGRIAGNTLMLDRWGVRLLTESPLRATLVAAIETGRVQGYIDGLSEQVAASSINRLYNVLNNVLRFAVRKRWVKRNPLRDDPARLPERSKRTAIPSRSDIDALLLSSSQRSEHETISTFVNRRLFITVGVFCGLRPGEICGLQWENVDLEKGIIRVRHSLSRVDGLKGQ